MIKNWVLVLALLPAAVCSQDLQLKKIDSLRGEISRAVSDTVKIRLHNAVSMEYSVFNPRLGIAEAKNAEALSIKQPNPNFLAESYGVLAINYNNASDFIKSEQYHKKSIAIFRKTGDRKKLAAGLNNLSTYYLTRSDYAKALASAFESLRIYEEIGQNTQTALVLENIGHIYYERSDNAKTRDYYLRALKIYKASGTQRDNARLMGNLARVFKDEKKYAQALEYLFAAYKINENLGLDVSMQANLANTGNVYISMGNFPLAVEYHSRALAISEKLGIVSHLAVNNGNLGGTYLKMGNAQDISKAIFHLKKAVDMCRSIGFSAPQIEFSHDLSEAYKRAGDFKNAYHALDEATKLRDSVFSLQSKVEMAGLETRREVEIRNKDIIIKNRELEIKRLEDSRDRMTYIFFIFILFIIIFTIVRHYVKRAKRHADAMANVIHIQSHVIRGPIASILGLAQLLKRNRPDDPENAELIDGINTLATELDEVVTKVVRDAKH